MSRSTNTSIYTQQLCSTTLARYSAVFECWGSESAPGEQVDGKYPNLALRSIFAVIGASPLPPALTINTADHRGCRNSRSSSDVCGEPSESQPEIRQIAT